MALNFPFSWQMFVERIRRHMNNNFPSSNYRPTVNEVLLYINEAMSFGLVGQVWSGAKVMGSIEVPEAYLVTFQLPALQQNPITGYWYSTLPQPPLSLPLGYSITRLYFANAANGIGTDSLPIGSKRVPYRMNMPMPFGVRHWVENSTVWIAASSNTSLLNQNCYIQMPSTRAVNITDPMPLPDDAAKMIFDQVVNRLKDRNIEPQENILDDIPQGNKQV